MCIRTNLTSKQEVTNKIQKMEKKKWTLYRLNFSFIIVGSNKKLEMIFWFWAFLWIIPTKALSTIDLILVDFWSILFCLLLEFYFLIKCCVIFDFPKILCIPTFFSGKPNEHAKPSIFVF